MLAGAQEALTEVTVGFAGGVLCSPVPPPPHPAKDNKPRRERASDIPRAIFASFSIEDLVRSFAG
jgi:hypothetical protein